MPLFSDPASRVEDPFLRRAFLLAERGRGATSPNPLVGCVIVRDGEVVGEGFHQRAGGPHAEVAALAQAAERARHSHVYVTLEPCNHVGRTPPCAPALVTAGVSEVTIGMPDPNPAVDGGGARLLVESGIAVRWTKDPGPFEEQNEAWLRRLRTGLPWVRVKVALTLDGRPALLSGRRSRLTGPGGRALTMRLRSEATAVGIGAGTLAIDQPALTVRDEAERPIDRQPQRIVLSRTTVPAPDAGMFVDGHGQCTVVVSDRSSAEARAALEGGGVRVVTYPSARGAHALLVALADTGIDDILVEAGPGLFASLWDERLIDELVIVSAGGLGGAGAPALYVGGAVSDGHDLLARMRAAEAGVIGEDAVTVWRPRASVGAPGIEKGSA